MKQNSKENTLTEDQSFILESFIKEFLPKRGNKSKNIANELQFISNTINWIFKKNFKFNVTPRHLLNAFNNLGYKILKSKGKWNSERKELKPSKFGTFVRADGVYSVFDAMYIHIDLNATTIRELRKLALGSPPNANQSTVLFKQQLQQKIDSFKNTLIIP